MAEKFKAPSLSDVHIDTVGNVNGTRLGKASAAKALRVAAHLNTISPPAVPTKVRREGDTLHAPGIGDTTVTMAALLAFLGAMDAGKVQTIRDFIFVANVGEEGPSVLRSVRHIFSASPLKLQVGDFISFDGSNVAHIVNGGFGSRCYRVAFKGPGGHGGHGPGSLKDCSSHQRENDLLSLHRHRRHLSQLHTQHNRDGVR